MAPTMSVTILLGAIIASQNIFRLALNNVVRAPASFFDQTPIGRTLSRLGRDVDVLDNTLPFLVNSLIEESFEVF